MILHGFLINLGVNFHPKPKMEAKTAVADQKENHFPLDWYNGRPELETPTIGRKIENMVSIATMFPTKPIQ